MSKPSKAERKRRRAVARAATSAEDPYQQLLASLSDSSAALLQHYARATVRSVRRWYIIEVPADGMPQVHQCRSFAEARKLLEERDGNEGWLFVFYGTRALLTSTYPRSIVHPNGAIYKLRPPPEDIQVSYGGYTGVAGLDQYSDEEAVVEFVEADEDADD